MEEMNYDLFRAICPSCHFFSPFLTDLKMFIMKLVDHCVVVVIVLPLLSLIFSIEPSLPPWPPPPPPLPPPLPDLYYSDLPLRNTYILWMIIFYPLA